MDSSYLLFLLRYGDIRRMASRQLYNVSRLSQIYLYRIALQSSQFYHSSRALRGATLVVSPSWNMGDYI